MANKVSLVNRLNKRVTLKRPRGPDDPPPDVDEYGQPIDNPITVATIWAGIEPLSGREFFAAKAVNAEVTTRIPIRWRPGIDRTMIVQYKEKGQPKFAEFEILYTINPEFRNEELQLMCKERQ
jgi:SPP1 family predicted phage head-tail adaptor